MKDRQAKVIAVVNQKGGTGKTTTTTNLGVALGKLGNKVLLIDMDAQGNMTFHFGVQNDYTKSMANVLTEGVKIKNITIEREKIDIAPSDVSLADAELSMVNAEGREFILKNAIDKVRDKYDYILIDCAPALSVLSINALTAADHILIPLQMEVLSMQGLSQILETVFQIKESLNDKLTILGILPVMFDKRRTVTHEIYNHIKENFGIRVLENNIGIDVRLVEAPSFGQSVFEYSPLSVGAMSYMRVARELLSIIPK
ncbi:ParA family protein [Flammeovirga kamogawensis]|uniref:AAA family ATPase n=1 Tax=Flammeovirga kamogawensis TaxID=373891 RepID=A0ABX8GQQ8_9BACT|nr:AAA family ATPase [Flammeovirga kamogawensis]MBB6462097.1 chromosome partitioning protein [Flammeovirga kamogawensis]QWG05831.1 AAA family ATPase [Flammeovirga kamogawensis]TRX67657.1 ParA family protein [Flammeovirga kamogawensis]